MRIGKVLMLAAALTLAVNSLAFAGGAVWFSAVGTLPGSTTDEGGRDLAPKVDCNPFDPANPVPGRCQWLVTVFYQNDDGGAFGAFIDVGTLPPERPDKLQIKDINIPQDGVLFTSTSLIGTNFGNLLIWNAGGGNATANGAPAGTYTILQFTLSKHKFPGEFQTTAIYAGVGFGAFGGNDPGGNGSEFVSIGPNPPIPGYNFYSWPDNAQPNPVLVINNVPEPATWGALGLGILCLVRRRR